MPALKVISDLYQGTKFNLRTLNLGSTVLIVTSSAIDKIFEIYTFSKIRPKFTLFFENRFEIYIFSENRTEIDILYEICILLENG